MPNTYPSLAVCDGTHLQWRTGMHVRTATNGKVRARALYSNTRYDPVLVHKLTNADWQTLKTFYDNNKGIPITLNYSAGGEAVTLTCIFADKPFDAQAVIVAGSAGLFEVTVYLLDAS